MLAWREPNEEGLVRAGGGVSGTHPVYRDLGAPWDGADSQCAFVAGEGLGCRDARP